MEDFLSGGSGTVSAAGVVGGKRSSRSPSLTGLRFVAASLVFAYPAALPVPSMRLFADDAVAYGFYDRASQAGGLGVGFFFVLSGFILTWSARPGDTPRTFWRRRFVFWWRVPRPER